MSDQPPDAGAPPGLQVSPDGLWAWNGAAWVPNPSPAMRMPVPYAAPAPTQYAPMAYPAAGGYVVAPKSPAVSLIVSLFLPGVGSMINGDVGIRIAILLLCLLAIALDVTSFGLIVGIPLGIGVFVWGLNDADQVA